MFLVLIAGWHLDQPARAQEENAVVLTLDQALKIARERNPDVLLAREESNKALAQVTEYRSFVMPRLTAYWNYTRNIQLPAFFFNMRRDDGTMELREIRVGSDNAYTGSLTLTQPLFRGGATIAAVKAAQIYVDVMAEAQQVTQADVLLAVKKAFYGVLLAQALLDAQQQTLHQAEAHWQNVKAHFEQGLTSEFEVLRAEIQVANLRPVVSQAENSLELAKTTLKNLIAIPLTQAIEVDGQLHYEPLDTAAMASSAAVALANRPEVRRLELMRSLLHQNIHIQRAAWFPSVNLVAAWQIQGQGDRFGLGAARWVRNANVGLQLSVPIFDSFQTAARVEEAQIELAKIEHQRRKLYDGIRVQTQQAQLKMGEAQRRIEAQQKSIAQAEKALKIAEVRYANGVGTQLELLDAQVALNRTRTNYIQALYDYTIAKAEWEYAIGRP